MTNGFIIVAQNSTKTNYIQCAELLCHSIKTTMPGSKVSLLTDVEIDNHLFDSTITFPYGDQCNINEWKLANDWQVYDASPYECTIKIEADMYIPRSIDHWWQILKSKNLVLSTTIRNYNNEISQIRHYRKIFDDNCLPDVYNGITYFKKSPESQYFFSLVRYIFENWQVFKDMLRCYDSEQATTDVVYAIAAKMIGVENCTMPAFKDMSFIHMKQKIIGTTMSDWSRELLYEISPECFRINTIPQCYPIHYHNKNLAATFLAELGIVQ